MNPDLSPMHWLSLCFKDVYLETSYVEEQERKSVRPRRMAALVAGVLISVMWALSFLGIQPIPLDLDRIAVLSITFLGGVALFYVLEGSRHFLRYRLTLNLALFLLFSAFLIGALSLVPPASLAVSGLALVIVHTLATDQ